MTRICGLDLDRESISACVRSRETSDEIQKSFGVLERDLIALRDWIAENEATTVAISSVGGFWRPVLRMLEDHVRVVLVHPDSRSKEPDGGRIARLLEQGVVQGKPSLPAALRELETLKRYGKNVALERRRAIHRLHKVLQDAGIRLSGVAKNIVGTSGRAILSALLQGETDAAALAELARGRLRSKLPQLTGALQGRFQDPHAFLVRETLAHIDYLDEVRDRLTARAESIAESLPAPFHPPKDGPVGGVDGELSRAILAALAQRN